MDTAEGITSKWIAFIYLEFYIDLPYLGMWFLAVKGM